MEPPRRITSLSNEIVTQTDHLPNVATTLNEASTVSSAMTKPFYDGTSLLLSPTTSLSESFIVLEDSSEDTLVHYYTYIPTLASLFFLRAGCSPVRFRQLWVARALAGDVVFFRAVIDELERYAYANVHEPLLPSRTQPCYGDYLNQDMLTFPTLGDIVKYTTEVKAEKEDRSNHDFVSFNTPPPHLLTVIHKILRAEANTWKESALLSAASMGQAEVVLFLLRLPWTDPDEVERETGRSALMLCMDHFTGSNRRAPSTQLSHLLKHPSLYAYKKKVLGEVKTSSKTLRGEDSIKEKDGMITSELDLGSSSTVISPSNLSGVFDVSNISNVSGLSGLSLVTHDTIVEEEEGTGYESGVDEPGPMTPAPRESRCNRVTKRMSKASISSFISPLDVTTQTPTNGLGEISEKDVFTSHRPDLVVLSTLTSAHGVFPAPGPLLALSSLPRLTYLPLKSTLQSVEERDSGFLSCVPSSPSSSVFPSTPHSTRVSQPESPTVNENNVNTNLTGLSLSVGNVALPIGPVVPITSPIVLSNDVFFVPASTVISTTPTSPQPFLTRSTTPIVTSVNASTSSVTSSTLSLAASSTCTPIITFPTPSRQREQKEGKVGNGGKNTTGLQSVQMQVPISSISSFPSLSEDNESTDLSFSTFGARVDAGLGAQCLDVDAEGTTLLQGIGDQGKHVCSILHPSSLPKVWVERVPTFGIGLGLGIHKSLDNTQLPFDKKRDGDDANTNQEDEIRSVDILRSRHRHSFLPSITLTTEGAVSYATALNTTTTHTMVAPKMNSENTLFTPPFSSSIRTPEPGVGVGMTTETPTQESIREFIRLGLLSPCPRFDKEKEMNIEMDQIASGSCSSTMVSSQPQSKTEESVNYVGRAVDLSSAALRSDVSLCESLGVDYELKPPGLKRTILSTHGDCHTLVYPSKSKFAARSKITDLMETVTVLVQHGARLDSSSFNGQSAFDRVPLNSLYRPARWAFRYGLMLLWRRQFYTRQALRMALTGLQPAGNESNPTTLSPRSALMLAASADVSAPLVRTMRKVRKIRSIAFSPSSLRAEAEAEAVANAAEAVENESQGFDVSFSGADAGGIHKNRPKAFLPFLSFGNSRIQPIKKVVTEKTGEIVITTRPDALNSLIRVPENAKGTVVADVSANPCLTRLFATQVSRKARRQNFRIGGSTPRIPGVAASTVAGKKDKNVFPVASVLSRTPSAVTVKPVSRSSAIAGSTRVASSPVAHVKNTTKTEKTGKSAKTKSTTPSALLGLDLDSLFPSAKTKSAKARFKEARSAMTPEERERKDKEIAAKKATDEALRIAEEAKKAAEIEAAKVIQEREELERLEEDVVQFRLETAEAIIGIIMGYFSQDMYEKDSVLPSKIPPKQLPLFSRVL